MRSHYLREVVTCVRHFLLAPNAILQVYHPAENKQRA